MVTQTPSWFLEGWSADPTKLIRQRIDTPQGYVISIAYLQTSRVTQFVVWKDGEDSGNEILLLLYDNERAWICHGPDPSRNLIGWLMTAINITKWHREEPNLNRGYW